MGREHRGWAVLDIEECKWETLLELDRRRKFLKARK